MAQVFLTKSQQNNISLFIAIATILLITMSPSAQAEVPKYQINKAKNFGYIRVGKSEAPKLEVKKEAENTDNKDTEKIKTNDTKKQTKNKIYKSPPWRLDAGLRIAEIEIASGKYTQSIKTLKKVLDRHPANTDAYTYIGYSYMKLGMLDKAEKNFGYALNMSPDHMGAHLYTGLLFLQQDKPRLAMESLHAIRVICKGMICNEEGYLSSKIDSHEENKKKRKN